MRSRLLLAALAMLAIGGVATAQPAAPEKTITVVDIKGGIDSAYADYIRGELRRADREGDLAIILQISSSGLVKTDLESLLDAVRATRTPVVTWINAKHAAKGGALLLFGAGDMRLRAADAENSSPLPIMIGGDPTDGLGYGTPENPFAIGTTGHDESQRVNSLRGVIQALRKEPLNLQFDAAGSDVAVRFANPNLWTRVKHALDTNPTLVYLLLLSGAAAIVFELFQPGFGPAGWAGIFLVAVSAIGLIGLPLNPIGFAVLVAGIGLLALDVARGGLGVITWGGTAALLAGSLTMFHSHGPALRVPWPALALGVGGSWLYYVVVMTLVLKALRGPVAELGPELVGKRAQVRSTLNPQGHVLVGGAIWRARAPEGSLLETGTEVTVTGYDVQALLLDVAAVAPEV